MGSRLVAELNASRCTEPSSLLRREREMPRLAHLRAVTDMSPREGIAMFETLHMSPRAILLAALIGGGALAVAPAARAQSVTACAAQASMLALNFTHEFAGGSQTDPQSDLWTRRVGGALSGDLGDRKRTRLNSSHSPNSY